MRTRARERARARESQRARGRKRGRARELEKHERECVYVACMCVYVCVRACVQSYVTSSHLNFLPLPSPPLPSRYHTAPFLPSYPRTCSSSTPALARNVQRVKNGKHHVHFMINSKYILRNASCICNNICFSIYIDTWQFMSGVLECRKNSGSFARARGGR